MVVVDDKSVQNCLVFLVKTFASSDVIQRVRKMRGNNVQLHVALERERKNNQNTRDVIQRVSQICCKNVQLHVALKCESNQNIFTYA